jgi:hypothetical protein
MKVLAVLLAFAITAVTTSEAQAQIGAPAPFYPQQFPFRQQYQPFPQYYPNQQFFVRPDRKTIERHVAYQLRQALCHCGVRDIEVDINSQFTRVEVEISVRDGVSRRVVRQRAWHALQSMPQLRGMRVEIDIDD